MSSKNKHGLSRHINENTKREIRKAAGFGCVVCGGIIVEYEHVDPEFSDAISHKADAMTLLCPTHNQQKKKGILSKEDIKKFKKNPTTKKKGHSFEKLYGQSSVLSINLGNSRFKKSSSLFIFNRVPFLWIDQPEDVDSPPLLNFIYLSPDRTIPLCIKNNELRVFDKGFDVVQQADRLTIKKDKSVILTINISLSKGFNIDEFHAIMPNRQEFNITNGDISVFGMIIKDMVIGEIKHTMFQMPYFNEPIIKAAKTSMSGGQADTRVASTGLVADGAFGCPIKSGGYYPLFWLVNDKAYDCTGLYWGRKCGENIIITEDEIENSEFPIPRFYYEYKNGVYELDFSKFIDE